MKNFLNDQKLCMHMIFIYIINNTVDPVVLHHSLKASIKTHVLSPNKTSSERDHEFV